MVVFYEGDGFDSGILVGGNLTAQEQAAPQDVSGG